MSIYNQDVGTLIDLWDKASAGGSSIEIQGPASLCTLDVMLHCAFSYDGDVQHHENKYVKAVNEIAHLITDRGMKPWMHMDWLYYLSSNGRRFKQLTNYVHQTAENIIKTRRQTLGKNTDERTKKNTDFLDILLLAKDDEGVGLSDAEIRDEVDTFLFEGHDTTSSAITWTLYELAKHPEIQQQCRTEVCNVIDDLSRPYINWDSLQKLPFLTQCIKEALRMSCTVPFPSRELTSTLDLDGHKLLPGTTISIMVIGVHHNREVWGDDHNEYKPERFNPDNMRNMDPYAFIPFSAGPRNCIGQNFAMHELKVVVGRVLQHFELSVDASHHVERLPEMVTKAKDGIKLFLKPLH
jgi:cytochrome P450